MPGVRKRFGYLPPTERRKYRGLPEEKAKTLSEATATGFRELLRDYPELVSKALASSPVFERAQEIGSRLLAADQDLLRDHHPKDRLNAFNVGLCFATLEAAAPDDRDWYLNRWFKWLGLRLAKVGRPLGRKAERKHYVCFKVFERRLEKYQVWSKKQELRGQFPRDWQVRLTAALRKQKWKPEQIEYVIRSKSPRSLALYLASCKAASHFLRRASANRSAR